MRHTNSLAKPELFPSRKIKLFLRRQILLGVTFTSQIYPLKGYVSSQTE